VIVSPDSSAGTQQAGTIGTATDPVDVESEDISNADTVTTQDLVVNGTATGPFGGGAPVLEAGDTITVATINTSNVDEAFQVLYSGTAKDVLGGIVSCVSNNDFLYTFSDSTTLRKNGTGTSYTRGNESIHRTLNNEPFETDFLPPAKDVTKIEVGGNTVGDAQLGAEVILKD